VAPNDVSVLNAPRVRPTLALVSCTPYGVDTQRVVVIAEMR
jgi:sortase (surface protein transpeptidase)